MMMLRIIFFHRQMEKIMLFYHELKQKDQVVRLIS